MVDRPFYVVDPHDDHRLVDAETLVRRQPSQHVQEFWPFTEREQTEVMNIVVKVAHPGIAMYRAIQAMKR